MCGISGIVSRTGAPVDASDLSRMLDQLAHRGPDAAGIAFTDDIAIGARRLSIVDVIHGAQPVSSENGGVIAVMNGEIFNHHELRRDLEARGFKFRTKCDAELVPALYAAYGRDFAKHLNGQFAIALYDFSEKLFLGWRDPFGICPFFYTLIGDDLIFASEVKGILAHRKVRRRLDCTGLDQILTFPGPISPRTMFEGVSSLPPGSCLEMARGREARTFPYWDLEFGGDERDRSDDAWSEELEALLLEAVRLRKAEEVATGLYLSGGIDSSLVGAMLRHLSPSADLDAFSIEFEDGLISEAKHQEMMRRSLGARAHVTKLDPRGVWSRLEAVVRHTETPLRETFNAASLALSEMAHASKHKVVLAGQGADELFAGYVGYRFDARPGQRQPAGSNAEAELNEALWGDPDFSYERRYGAFADTKLKLYSPDLRASFADFDCVKAQVLTSRPPASVSRLQRRSYVDCKLRLGDHLLSGHGDRMAMASSVEVRYPFLDKNVAAFAARAHDAIKLRPGKEKFVVKSVGARWLPSEIVDREKFGFTAPGSPALLTLNDERVADLLSDDRIRRQNVFDVEEVARLKARYATPGFRIAVPFETDLLITVITYGMFSEMFQIPDL